MYKIGSSIISTKSVSKVGTTLKPSLYYQCFRFSISALRSENATVNHNGSDHSNFHNYFGKSPQFDHLNDSKHLNGDSDRFHDKRTDICPRSDLNRSSIGSVDGIAGQLKNANSFPDVGSDSNGFMKEACNQTTNSARVEPVIGNWDLRNRVKVENTKPSPNKDGIASNKKKHSYYFECLSKLQERYNQVGDSPENKDRDSDFNPFQDVNKEFKFRDLKAGQTAGVTQNKVNSFDNLQRGSEEKERNNFENFPQNFNQNHSDKGSVDGPRVGKQFNHFEKSNLYHSKNKIRPNAVNYPNELQRKSGLPGRGGDASVVRGERVGLRNVSANNMRNLEYMQQNGNRVHAGHHHNAESVERPRIGGPFNHFSPDMYPNPNVNEYRGNGHQYVQNRADFRIDGPLYLNPNLVEHHEYDYHNMYTGEDFRNGGQLNRFNRPDMFPNSNHFRSIRGQNPNVFQGSNMINGVDNFQGWRGNPGSVYGERFDLPCEYVNDCRGYGNMPQTFNPYHQNMGSIEGFRNGGQVNHFNNFQYMSGGGFVKGPHINEYDSRNMVGMHDFANQYQRYNQVPDFREGPFNGCQNFNVRSGVYDGRFSPNLYQGNTQVPSFRGGRPFSGYQNSVGVGNGVYEERISPTSYQGNNQAPSFREEVPFNGYQNLRGVGSGVYEERLSPNSYHGNNQVPNFREEGPFNDYQNLRGMGNGVYEERFSPNSYQGNNQVSNFVEESHLNGYQNSSGIGNEVYRGRSSPNSEYDRLNPQKLYNVNARGLQNAFQGNNQVSNLRGEGFLNGNHNSRGVGNGAYDGRVSPHSDYDWSDQQNSYDFNARGVYSMQQNAYQRYSQASNLGVAETFQREESKFTRSLDQMNDFQSVSYTQRTGSQFTYRDQYGNMSARLQKNSNGCIQQLDADGLHGENSNGHNSISNNPVSGNVLDS